MNRKEMFKELFDSFFVIFTISIMGYVVYMYLLGLEWSPLHDIVTIFIMSIFATLSGIIIYPKREPKRVEIIVRYLLHAVLILAIGLGTATYMQWIYWGNPISVIQFAALSFGIFITVHAIIFYQTKKLADTLNEKLKEHYKRLSKRINSIT